MKVLMFGWEFPPYVSGGLGRACYGLTKAMAEIGIDMIFVMPKMPYGERGRAHFRLVGVDDPRYSRITLESKREKSKSIKFITVPSLLRAYATPEQYTSYFKEWKEYFKVERVPVALRLSIKDLYGPDIWKAVELYALKAEIIAYQEDFDVIHAHDWMTFPAAVRAKKISGKPLVVHIHSTEYDRSGENINHAIYNIERTGMIEADKVIAVSGYTKSVIINRYGIEESKIEIVYNALTRDIFSDVIKKRKKFKEKVVLFLGRVTFQKGPEYFVEAAYKVMKQRKDVRFIMSGTGDMLFDMILRSARLRIGPNFHFTGFVTGHYLEEIYAQSDLYVMPSVSEPFGLAALEAACYDVPIIVSKQSGVVELLPDCIKVDFWDVDGLAYWILRLLSDEELARQQVASNRRRLRNIKWEIAAEKLRKIYISLCGEG